MKPVCLLPALEPAVGSILVADDSPTVRKILEYTLRREGYLVRAFPDGVSMLRWLHGGGSVPRLIFLDLVMPRMDGYQVASHLRKQAAYAGTILVLHTRCNGLLDRLKARLIGIEGYLAKPSTTQQILSLAGHYCSPPLPEEVLWP
ncbi:response regulator [Ktedonosporobacter rubrisoli]|uniref:Response regulator n=1 Tax=Ktedonosporobacter rubrisoli TaxID=2509675 RepID=A0A4P6JKS0_KTERU|nr:response regulator [Ktedonosporobacter rubrisoli]QBD75764.1 response regulator [Ktedonosporobacter rubrisoli]